MADGGRVIVIAMDGSECSEYAFDWYMNHFHRKDDHVVLVHCPEYQTIVHSSLVMTDIAIVADQIEEQQKRIKDFLEKLGQKLLNAGIGGKVKSQGGNPGEVIVRLAEEEKASVIITGSRGLGVIRRTLVGSVSDYVLHHAHVPVTICRHKTH